MRVRARRRAGGHGFVAASGRRSLFRGKLAVSGAVDPILLHLRVNHIPILVLPIAFLLLGFAFLRRDVRDLWLAAAVVATIAFAGAVTAVQTGEGAEHADDRIADADHDLIEVHEEGAKPAAAVTGLSAVLAWACWFASRKSRPHVALGSAAMVATAVAIVAMVRVGNAGGKIGHPEIRGAPVPLPEDHEHESDHGEEDSAGPDESHSGDGHIHETDEDH